MSQRVCYFGDHLLQDVLLPVQRMTNWDVVAVIKELQLLEPPVSTVAS